MGRLSARLKEIKDSGVKSLVAYIVAGDPLPKTTVPLMHDMAAAGGDVFELGMPFSDPEAEGPVIQRAHERALKHKISLLDILEMVREFRQTDTETPVILMGYLNPIETMGYKAFAQVSAHAGVDGTIIVNLPPEEAVELSVDLDANDIEMVYLLAPTTTDERAKMICEASQGFVYYVSLKGTTGAATLDTADVAEKMARFRDFSQLPVMVGFGIKDGPSARAVADLSDGAVVGSAIVNIIDENKDDPVQIRKRVKAFILELRSALDA